MTGHGAAHHRGRSGRRGPHAVGHHGLHSGRHHHDAHLRQAGRPVWTQVFAGHRFVGLHRGIGRMRLCHQHGTARPGTRREALGGGGFIILSQATIADVIPPRQRGKYMGVIGSVFALATVVGPLLGGWFVQVTGWRWLFAFNVPLALLAIAAVMFFRNRNRCAARTVRPSTWAA